MSKPTIIVTGAGGFIGEYLVNKFSINGWVVKAFIHKLPKLKIEGVEYIEYDLNIEPKKDFFVNVDFLVHCAFIRFDSNKNSSYINLMGTQRLIEICREFNIKPVFLSSFSAHEKAESEYGKSKVECEKLFDISKDVILKTGFVIGEKGLASEIIKVIKKSSIIPIVAGGNQPLQTIYINDLFLIIYKVLEDQLSGIFYIAEEIPISIKIFYQEISTQLEKKIILISIPLKVIYLGCIFAEFFKIRLPVTSESVLGLKQLKKFESKDDLKKLEIQLKNYTESLKIILK